MSSLSSPINWMFPEEVEISSLFILSASKVSSISRVVFWANKAGEIETKSSRIVEWNVYDFIVVVWFQKILHNNNRAGYAWRLVF